MTRIDLYVDPVCPFGWTASQWLFEVERHCDLDLRLQLMSLAILNVDRELPPAYRRLLDVSTTPARIAAGVLHQHGEAALRDFYVAFTERVFSPATLRRGSPEPAAYAAVLAEATRATLHDLRLPGALADAAQRGTYDEVLAASHRAGLGPLGSDGGTPVLHVDGVAFFGPVLMTVPRGAAAEALLDALVTLAASHGFVELKRGRAAA